MDKRVINNLKLGIFVIAGLLFLITLLYMLGKNKSFFGSSFILKTSFTNIDGLIKGNNVRFSGIHVGTVKSIDILNDTLIEVEMTISDDMLGIIKNTALSSVGTEGLVGNKVINIVPSKKSQGVFVKDNDFIFSRKAINTDAMIENLSEANDNIVAITSSIQQITHRLNSNNAMWTLLNDKTIPLNVKSALSNLNSSSNNLGATIQRVDDIINDIGNIVTNVKSGKGSLGEILVDSSMSYEIKETIADFRRMTVRTDSVVNNLSVLTDSINSQINSGNGLANAILNDKALLERINSSLENIKMGADGFNQNMEALKHNFFFRGYFKKLEKEKEKQKQKSKTQKRVVYKDVILY